jgi:hypothetical protein
MVLPAMFFWDDSLFSTRLSRSLGLYRLGHGIVSPD